MAESAVERAEVEKNWAEELEKYWVEELETAVATLRKTYDKYSLLYAEETKDFLAKEKSETEDTNANDTLAKEKSEVEKTNDTKISAERAEAETAGYKLKVEALETELDHLRQYVTFLQFLYGFLLLFYVF